MIILHITSEFYPIAKVGGLGDVVSSLAKEQTKKGDTVWVALPFYNGISLPNIKNVTHIEMPNKDLKMEAWQVTFGNCNLILIKDCAQSLFFCRSTIYGHKDDVSRFCAFSSAVMHIITFMISPDVIHMHDWPASYAVLFRKNPKFCNTSFVFTIHNPETQGLIEHSTLQYFCCPIPQKQENICNGLATAIEESNLVTTVSPQYCKELQEEPAGRGLSSLLRKKANAGLFHGVLNGIDTCLWNPEEDYELKNRYGLNNILFENNHPKPIAKRKIALDLSKELSFSYDESKPLIMVLSRLTWQKGVDLLFEVLPEITQNGISVVVLGETFNHEIYEKAKKTAELMKPFGRLVLEHNESLVHKLLGSADILLMPSIFEPCGLTQMMAMRYGVIPVVRSTGGLIDTVFDFDFSCRPENERNGFVFMNINKQGLYSALNRALDGWKNPSHWHIYVKQAMRFDRDWNEAANVFDNLYRYR